MTVHFKKIRNFDKMKFMEEFERSLEEEGDIYVVDNLEESVEDDSISPFEEGFMCGYLSA